MEPFVLIKRKLILLAIMPIPKENLSSSVRELQNYIHWLQIALVYSVLMTYFLAPLYFLLFEADTFITFIEATFMATVTLLKVLLYGVFIWKGRELLDLLLELQNIIKLSKTNLINLFSKYFIKNRFFVTFSCGRNF